MDVSIGEQWEAFAQRLVQEGRYSSVSEVIREGLRLVGEREAKLTALGEEIRAAIAEGGAVGPEEVDRDLDEFTRELKTKGN